MNDQKLREAVTQACRLDRKIALLKEMLDVSKKQLISEAEGRAEERTPTEGGGWSWTAEGTDGNICRVTSPGDALKSSIDGEGKAIEKVREAAGLHFGRLFLQAPKWKPVENFRKEAADLLGKGAGKLIKLVTKSCQTSVSFETKESV